MEKLRLKKNLLNGLIFENRSVIVKLLPANIVGRKLGELDIRVISGWIYPAYFWLIFCFAENFLVRWWMLWAAKVRGIRWLPKIKHGRNLL